MSNLPWRQNAFFTLAAVTLSLHPILVKGISIDCCSMENTGGSNAPENYGLQSLGHCRDQCSGSAYAITQGQDCWCSDNAPSTCIDNSACNEQCPGYPYEVCGSSSGAYSYIQIGNPHGNGNPYEGSNSYESGSPYGTGQPQGTGNPFATPPRSSSYLAPSVPSSSIISTVIISTIPPNTVYQTIQDTVVSNNVVIRTTAIVQTSVYSAEPETVTQVRTAVVSVTPRPITTIVSASRPTTTLQPQTSTQYLTVSGGIRTRYITTFPSGTGLPIGSTADITATHQGLSNGAVAGITVGVIAAVAVAVLVFFLCCWRRRKDKDSGAGINRNTSVLSKVGLLRHGSTRPATGAAVVPISTSPPRLDTAIPGASGPPSTSTVGMLERRESRPLFRDNRLNPNVLMVHSDTSRTSVGTLQDNEDYSRPLKVANPDQPNP